MQQIGQLFLLRTNINSVGSVLDSPVRPSMLLRFRSNMPPLLQEVFWARLAGFIDGLFGLTRSLTELPRSSTLVRRSSELPRNSAENQLTQHTCRGWSYQSPSPWVPF